MGLVGRGGTGGGGGIHLNNRSTEEKMYLKSPKASYF
jgi:hypothetical protein